MFESLKFRNWDLPFDFAQGGELVEPFVIWCLEFLFIEDSTVMKYRCVFVMDSIVYPITAPVAAG